jgi:hypothetical protein
MHNFVSVLENGNGSTIKKMKREENGNVEAAFYEWFIENRSAGQPTSGQVLCEKALMLERGVFLIRNEFPPQSKTLCWTFFSYTGMNFNTLNIFVIFKFVFILTLVFCIPNYPNFLLSGQLESPISPDNRSSIVLTLRSKVPVITYSYQLLNVSISNLFVFCLNVCHH